DREEACDQRSAPQDVTSSWAQRGGVNLQPEVAPQQTERPPRDSPVEDTPDVRPGVKLIIQADGGGLTVFRSSMRQQPPPLLSFVVRVRHDVVAIAVRPVEPGPHQLFCQLYPTAACVPSNGRVRSLRDNVALSLPG